jgi:hypothetical protein
MYWALDRHFGGRTRFFAAAAMTNQMFAMLFKAAPHLVSRRTGNFLSELGARLEIANVRFADEIRRHGGRGASLDRHLVSSEQNLVQAYVDAVSVRVADWHRIGYELNRLLNGTHLASLAASVVSRTRGYRRVLAEARRRTGGHLDFAHEAHRVSIGCALVHHVREQEL